MTSGEECATTRRSLSDEACLSMLLLLWQARQQQTKAPDTAGALMAIGSLSFVAARVIGRISDPTVSRAACLRRRASLAALQLAGPLGQQV